MSRTAKNVLYNIIGQGILLVISLASTRLLVGNLSQDVYGLISFAMLLNTTITLVIVSGIGLSLVREISQNVDSNRLYIEQLLQTSSFLYWGLALAAGALLWSFAPWIAGQWLHLERLPLHTAIELLRILSISAVIAIPSSLYNVTLRGMEQMKTTNTIDVARAIVTQAGIIILLVGGTAVNSIAWWIVLANFLGVGAYVVALSRSFSRKAFLPLLHTTVLRRNVKLALSFSVMSITGVVHGQVDKLIVSMLLPVAHLGYYNFAYQLIQRATFIRASVGTALYPSFSRLSSEQINPDLQQQYRKWFDLLCIGLAPIITAAMYISGPLYGYIFDANVAELMIVPVMLLTLGTYMNITLAVPHITAMAVGRPDITGRANVYAVLIMVPLTYGLIWLFGLRGAAVTWPVYHLVMYALFIPYCCRECLAIPPAQWYLHTGQILLAILLTYGMTYGVLIATGNATSLTSLTVGYLIASGVFAVLSIWLMSVELRQTLYGLPQLQRVLINTRRIVGRQPR